MVSELQASEEEKGSDGGQGSRSRQMKTHLCIYNVVDSFCRSLEALQAIRKDRYQERNDNMGVDMTAFGLLSRRGGRLLRQTREVQTLVGSA